MVDYINMATITLAIIAATSFFIGKLYSKNNIKNSDKESNYIIGFLFLIILVVIPIIVFLFIEILILYSSDTVHDIEKKSTSFFIGLLILQLIIQTIIISIDETILTPPTLPTIVNNIVKKLIDKFYKKNDMTDAKHNIIMLSSLPILLFPYIIIRIYFLGYIPNLYIISYNYLTNLCVIASIMYTSICIITVISLASESILKYPHVRVEMNDGSTIEGKLKKFGQFVEVINNEDDQVIFINETIIKTMREKSDIK